MYPDCRRGRQSGVWQAIHDALRPQARQALGRHPRQPVGQDDRKRGAGGRTRASREGPQTACGRGYPGLAAGRGGAPADLQDRDGARLVLARLRHRCPRLRRLWADAGHAGPKLGDWVQATTDRTLDIVRRSEPGAGFRVLPRRWVVERTFAWLGRHRRLSKDYAVRPDTTEAWIHAAMTDLMLRRLAQT